MIKHLLVLWILILFAAGAAAQDATAVSIWMGGGLGFPAGPEEFRDGWTPGINLTGGVGFNVDRMFSLIGRLEVHAFPLDIPDEAQDFTEGGTLSAVLFGGEAALRLAPPDGSIAFYGMFGMGIAAVTVNDVKLFGYTILEGEEEAKPYFSFTGGMEFELSPELAIFAQGRLVVIAFDEESKISHDPITIIPFTMGLKVNL